MLAMHGTNASDGSSVTAIATACQSAIA